MFRPGREGDPTFCRLGCSFGREHSSVPKRSCSAGTRRIYRLNPTAVAALRDQLDAFWRRTLAGYAEATDVTDEAGIADDTTEESP